MSTPVLEIRDLSKSFGTLHVMNGFAIRVEAGERRLILGPNGAGKTTLFNLITGEIKPGAGSVKVSGREVSALCTARRAALGIGRTYQILTLFQRDTVEHNVILALLGRDKLRWHPLRNLASRHALREQAHDVLQRVGLASHADKSVGAMSYGEKRRLEIALALAQQPKLLLLDEPLAGLSADERLQIQAMLLEIPRTIATVMIEHDMDVALSFAERISLLQHGKLILDGSREEVVNDPRTREVYLGH